VPKGTWFGNPSYKVSKIENNKQIQTHSQAMKAKHIPDSRKMMKLAGIAINIIRKKKKKKKKNKKDSQKKKETKRK